jgi:hypothetical protein
MTEVEEEVILTRARAKDVGVTKKTVEKSEVFLEASLVAYSLDNPTAVMTVECRRCKENFQTNYRFQKYCSLECLEIAMLKRGLHWDREKPLHERWQGLPPQTIQPETLKQLLVWAREIVRQAENPDTAYPQKQALLTDDFEVRARILLD